MADVATLKFHNTPQSTPATQTGASAPAVKYAFAMATDRGRKRSSNQDCCAALPEHGVFVVCDGMGGAAAGDVASQIASQSFLDCIAQRCTPPPDGVTSESAALESAIPDAVRTAQSIAAPARPRTRLADAIRAANQAVFRHSRTSTSLHGMGTTLIALLWDSFAMRRQDDPPTPPIWLAHVGDSRCYLFRAGSLQRLTTDHSLVEEQVRAGVLNRVQATVSPMRNIITRAIGSRPTVEAEIVCQPTEPGDLYLLASDGLTRELDDAAIATILNRMASPETLEAARATSDLALQAALDAACKQLIDAANAKGGRDNITVLLVPCP